MTYYYNMDIKRLTTIDTKEMIFSSVFNWSQDNLTSGMNVIETREYVVS
jgi:hypothetical protein